EDGEADDLWRGPGPGAATKRRGKHKRGQAGREQHEAEIVDRALYALTLWLEHHGDDDQGDDADRQIEQKNPLPGEMLDDETAEDRAGNGRYAEDGTEEALHLAALAGWN